MRDEKRNTSKRRVSLTVVIPSYNAAKWLPKTISKIEAALVKAEISNFEILIVDDGSSDNTVKIAQGLKSKYKIKLISQKNSGRFLARKRGVLEAQNEWILLIDTRVFIGELSLKYVFKKIYEDNSKKIWNAHVNVVKTRNPIARFGDTITFIGWRRYFSNPRECSYGIKDFDYYPKGTTMFLAPKGILIDAIEWFEKNTTNIKVSNDDTLMIRHIAESNRINLSPDFNCFYHARTSLKQFIKHSYHRGMVFVDGFLRRDGNRFFYPLILFLILSIVIPATLILLPKLIIPFLALFLGTWLIGFVALLLLGVQVRDAGSFFVLSPLFLFVYSLGIWRAVNARLINKGDL